MAHIVTRGLVLREVAYKESDKILTVLLEGEGKRTVKAPGCRRKNSPLSAGSQALAYAEMSLFDYRDRWSLKEANTIQEFRNIPKSIEKLSLASYFAEVCEAVAEEGVEVPGLLSLALNSLYMLDKMGSPEGLIKAVFELKAACLAGYEPLLDACAVCGRSEPEEPRLSLNEGVLHCAGCRRELGEEGVSLPLDGPALAAMRYVAYGNPKRLFSFTLPERSLEVFSGVCESFLLTQLERGFQTLDFYKSLLP